ncbi:MAG TPA: NUDIX hydrolase [Patescibacteria group bacterium]|jgi:8-oxo-dGTP pyrophosphatase MutT (NUDIX family)
MKLQKWKLISAKDVSPSKWFPIENRTYQTPEGRIVNDFFVTTLSDSVHTIAITKDERVVMIQIFKQGADDIMIQFPAGRVEKKHSSVTHAAVSELEEETGISVLESDLKFIGKLSLMSTKATEIVHYYLATDVELNSNQNLDENEEIEILFFTSKEIDQMIIDGKIWDAPCIAGWELAKKKFADYLGY